MPKDREIVAIVVGLGGRSEDKGGGWRSDLDREVEKVFGRLVECRVGSDIRATPGEEYAVNLREEGLELGLGRGVAGGGQREVQ